jgi:hypothetical protein
MPALLRASIQEPAFPAFNLRAERDAERRLRLKNTEKHGRECRAFHVLHAC